MIRPQSVSYDRTPAPTGEVATQREDGYGRGERAKQPIPMDGAFSLPRPDEDEPSHGHHPTLLPQVDPRFVTGTATAALLRARRSLLLPLGVPPAVGIGQILQRELQVSPHVVDNEEGSKEPWDREKSPEVGKLVLLGDQVGNPSHDTHEDRDHHEVCGEAG